MARFALLVPGGRIVVVNCGARLPLTVHACATVVPVPAWGYEVARSALEALA